MDQEVIQFASVVAFLTALFTSIGGLLLTLYKNNSLENRLEKTTERLDNMERNLALHKVEVQQAQLRSLNMHSEAIKDALKPIAEQLNTIQQDLKESQQHRIEYLEQENIELKSKMADK